MAADVTYTHGTDQWRTSRPDLGDAMARWFSEYGLGPNSKYVALRASGRLDVPSSGQVHLETKTLFYDAKLSDKSYKRPVGGDFHPAPPTTVEAYYANPVDFGMPAEFDDNDPLNVRKSAGDVETKFTRKSLNRLLQGSDISLLGALAAGSTPFDYTDIDVDADGGNGWDASTTAIVANIRDAQLGIDGRPDAAIVPGEADTHFRNASELTTRFGGNIGAGTLSDAMVGTAYRSFGLTQVFVCDTASSLGDKVVMYFRGSGDPENDPCALIRTVQVKPGQDAFGIEYFTGDNPQNPRKHYALAVSMQDFIIVSNAGVRLADVYQ